jgi:hypothetical protein
MPRKPTEKVVEHRITLGTYERQMFSDAVAGYNFKNIATPVVSGLSDISFLIFIGGILGIALDRALGIGWREATEFLVGEGLSDWLETQNLVGAGIGGALGLLVGNPFIGAIAGSAVVEAGEYFVEEFTEVAQDNPKIVSAWTSLMLRSYWEIQKLKETV